MKFLTIRQPWASLIAVGAKTIETRPFSTTYRGPLAIHAGAFRPKHCSTVGEWQVLDQADGVLRLCGPPRFDLGAMPVLPLGAVVAVADLVDVVPIAARGDECPMPCVEVGAGRLDYWWPPSGAPGDEAEEKDVADQLPFGDFTPGRYAWLLDNVRAIEPVSMKGAQGLRDVTADIAAAIDAQIGASR